MQFRRPNEALLSINCFQKDLGDTNPLVRAWALRTMAGIRLHVIAPIVLVAVQKCARDPSVYVRKCAANALPKLHDLRLEENTETIEEVFLCLTVNIIVSNSVLIGLKKMVKNVLMLTSFSAPLPQVAEHTQVFVNVTCIVCCQNF